MERLAQGGEEGRKEEKREGGKEERGRFSFLAVLGISVTK